MTSPSLADVNLMALLDVPGVGSARARKFLCILKGWRGEVGQDTFLEAARRVLSEQQLSEYEGRRVAAEAQCEELRRNGVHLIAITDPIYPQSIISKLGDEAPLLLLCRGNLNLLQTVSVGFCGSRAASEKGLTAAWDSAFLLAKQRVNIVSGFAAGVDMNAHRAALSAGGTTTIVLAEGMLRFRIKKEIKDDWDDERILVVSEFGTSKPWSVGHAMQRNRTICALSNALILVEARSEGGSIAAGRECMKMGLPLFAAVYDGAPRSSSGNQEVLHLGAKPLMKSRSTNLPNLKPVIEILTPPREDDDPVELSNPAAGYCA